MQDSNIPGIIVGGVRVANPLFLAPMAGVTVSAVRRLFRRLGVSLTHTEMVSSCGMLFGGEKTVHMTDYTEEEQPLVLQLFDGDAGRMCRSAELCLRGHEYAAFSINMACPMPKVMKRGAGSRLLTTPDIAAEMVRELKKFGLPVWPKIRKMIPDGKNFAMTTAQFTSMLLEAGADCVAIHGRTPAQRYEGISDREEVYAVARAFPGKIVGSGDVYLALDVKEYMDAGCCGVLLARGAVANPFMTVQSLGILGYNIELGCGDVSTETRAALLIDFANDLKNIHGEHLALVLVKRFVPGFFKERKGITEFKRALAAVRDWETMYGLLTGWRPYFERGLI